MRTPRFVVSAAALLLAWSCATSPGSPPIGAHLKSNASLIAPGEIRFRNLRQLTFGGENAEAYWSFDTHRLVFQAHGEGQGCDRIYQMEVKQERPTPQPVSSGKGATTCAFFLPGDDEVIYASTHEGGDACPPRPDMSQGYVWALHQTYDIFKLNLRTQEQRKLTDTGGYDAEATVCGKDGSIVFTSVRDGDLELYRMDRDGQNVKRLTSTPGYDGGAFFSADCSKIVWRASRPSPGKELEDYQRLLSQNLVRPSKLELWVANADGTEARQVTYLGAASFAPFFHPSGNRILFSSNYPNPRGRAFDIWAIDVDGTHLERITHSPGFDGFPMFSPDGRMLAFSSNRATAPGRNDTNVFVAEWVETAPAVAFTESLADRVLKDVTWLADPSREGRGIGTKGLEAAGAWLEARFQEIGLEPAGENGTFRQSFPVTTSVEVEQASFVTGKRTLGKNDVVPLGFSASGTVRAPMVLAGYGVSEASVGRDDYARLDVKGRIAVVRRFVPEGEAFSSPEAQRRHGDIRHKAWIAREKGAKALVVVDLPEKPAKAPADWKMPDEARISPPHPEGYGDAGLPVVFVRRAAAGELVRKLEAKQKLEATLTVKINPRSAPAFNVAGRLRAGAPESKRLRGAVMVGAHYDHLGLGGRHSLAPDKQEVHVGADDNASGTAALLAVARALASNRESLARDVVFVAFAGEEEGILGSTHFTRTPPPGTVLKDITAMVNMDMVGRLRANSVSVLGGDSAKEWTELVAPACERARVTCVLGGDGYGPSDHTPFYSAGVPVLHFFTGAHADYHKPTDVAAGINAAGLAKIAEIVSAVTSGLAARETALTYKSIPSPLPRGDMRSFNASLGTIPDYAGPSNGAKGMLLAGVRPGGAAEQAGMKRGDLLVKLGNHPIGSVEDLMYVLNASQPGETVTAIVVRDGREVPLQVTFQESKRR
jgi:Tol biopolymer transport system component